MAITLPPISRRRFLSASVAASAAWIAGCSHQGRSERPVDPNRFALLSDTHINADKANVHSKVRVWDNFAQVSREVLDLSPQPAAVLMSGDCVFLEGRSQDYATLVKAAAPFRRAGIPVHMAMGNHDRRDNYWKAFPPDPARQTELGDRHVLLVSSPYANFFLLDGLLVNNKTPGLLGPEQLAWLAKSLDAHADKPAILVLHHQLDEVKKTDGLVDTQAVLDVIVPRKQVKAYVYGHTHVWRHTQRDGIHLINLPATAWIFDAKQPNGWTDLILRPDGATFTLHALDPKHSKHGQKFDVVWRI